MRSRQHPNGTAPETALLAAGTSTLSASAPSGVLKPGDAGKTPLPKEGATLVRLMAFASSPDPPPREVRRTWPQSALERRSPGAAYWDFPGATEPGGQPKPDQPPLVSGRQSLREYHLKKMEAALTYLSIISWNLHRGRGEDGVVDAGRTTDVLSRIALEQPVDLLVLQEADEERAPHRGILDLPRIEARTGLRSLHAAPASRWGSESHGFLGVVMLAAPHVHVEDIVLLDLPGHCHRGAVIADIRKDGVPVRVVGTHLSLTQVFRIAQMRTLGQHLFRRDARATILCGDLNEWRPWGGLAFSRSVLGDRFTGPVTPTFPVRRPLLPLDRVLAAGGARVTSAQVLDGAEVLTTSDHRPLRAEVEIAVPGDDTRGTV